MSVNNGYLIPADPSPLENRCVRVYVPNDPLYMAALLGTLTYLGQWTAWERDALHRGSQAATRWRDANDLTLDGLSLPCGDNQITDDEMSEILDQLARIQSQLAELNDMNITVTQTAGGCGCGCSDGSTTTTTTTTSPPIISPDETGIVPIYNTETVVVVDSVKCRSANYLAAKVSYMVRMLGNLGDGGATIAGIITLLVTIITWLTPIPGDEVLATSALIYYAMMIANTLRTADDFAFSIFGDLADEIDGNMQAFVCALYGWETSSELGSSLSSFVNAKIDQIQPASGMSTETATALKNVLNSLIGPAIINWFVDHISNIVPADFTPMYSCVCGATGNNCPTQNLTLKGYGAFPATLDGIEWWTSEFNSETGYHEIIFELSSNWCVNIQYYDISSNYEIVPLQIAHEKCNGSSMVYSDGACLRRYVVRHTAHFTTAVNFIELSTDCSNCSGEFIDLSSCSLYLEGVVGVTSSDVAGGDTELTASITNGVVSFDFRATGATVASTPRATLSFVFADNTKALSVRVLRVYDVVTEGTVSGGYIDIVTNPWADSVIAGSVSSSIRPCIAAAILDQLGLTVTVSNDVTKTIEIGTPRPGAGNFAHITGKIAFFGEPVP